MLSVKEGAMKRILWIGSILIVLFTPFIGMSDIVVLYKSGDCSVDIEGNGAWKEALIDMELQNHSLIRTGRNGEVEIDINGEVISIGSNKTMKVGELVRTVEEKKKQGWLKGLKRYTKNVRKGSDEYIKTALAGVRGAQSADEELVWFEEDEGDVDIQTEFQRGVELFENGEFTHAIDVFKPLIETHGDAVLDGEVVFYMGISMFNVLRFDEASSSLEKIINNKTKYYHNIALIHYSLSQYFLKNYTKSIEGLTAFIQETNEDQLKPYALLMLGKNYKDMGNKSEAKKFFTEVENDYSNTDLAQAAQEEMEGL